MKYTTKKQVIDVNLALLQQMSKQLASQISKTGYHPDHIIYIEQAGVLPGFEMASFFNCPVSGIRSKRSGTSLKSRVKLILRFLPRFVTHFLRRLEISSSIHDRNKKRVISSTDTLPSGNKNVLIVDDAIDTGHSLGAVLNYLEEKGIKKDKIKIAVLTTTGSDPVFSADYTLLDQVICAFPWSYDSRDYKETLKMIKTLKQLTSALPVYSLERQRIISKTNILAT